ncbi:hypothetical protein [Neorhodopirellula lusitana]|uniref:hypothetical protein n=1 Tax=Neorhodopirellula lusitana TaxID=445327 RepID=UPI0038517525
MRDYSSLTLKQLRSKLRVKCCLKTIWMELHRQEHTHKKSRCMPANKSEVTLNSEVTLKNEG